ncbi:AAA domain-containing protein [Arthrobacter sp. TMP15]|uniref:AAA domain-containing protein n=1 Tax=Arthrobacter sp. TMP15 TaxID=3140789 RepID=UPI0031BB03C6
MIDPRSQAILIHSRDGTLFQDKTQNVLAYRVDRSRTYVTMQVGGGEKEYGYGSERVVILHNPKVVPLTTGTRVQIHGAMRSTATEARRFQGPRGPWWRIFFVSAGEDVYQNYAAEEVSFHQDAAQSSRASGVLDYWRRIVSGLDAQDPLRFPFGKLGFVDAESALAAYVNAVPIERSTITQPLIFPFSANLSQREAVTTCLSHPISVIDGPPGTGKTQTILNLIANIIATPGATVGIVSFNNSAVDNVREKLEEEGFGYVVAGLGSREKKVEFFARQSSRNEKVSGLIESSVTALPPEEQLSNVDERLQLLQQTELQLAQLRQEHDAYLLEQRHFSKYLQRHEPAELENLPLLHSSSGTILDYLAETAQWRAGENPLRRWARAIRGYFRYGPTGKLDPTDTDTLLHLQRAYYDNKISELQREIKKLEQTLEQASSAQLAKEHRQLSIQALRAGLQQRYGQSMPKKYALETYKHDFSAFTHDYPVILSTCHSLGLSLPDGYLLDYLIIDESSQLNLLAAGLVLKSARNVIVVGDLHQLQHIAHKAAGDAASPAPAPAYDYQRHNILSSVIALHGEALPRTMLREHYRCDPAIIGFCNKKYYDGQLVPFTAHRPEMRPLRIVRTAAGNHMREHLDGGRSNQREIDVVVQEVIEGQFADTDKKTIGIATPYRIQAGKFTEQLTSIQADTVHKFQGREKEVVIMSTVLDETALGRKGVAFVDDPHLINVAVSRASKQFVLVTNHGMLPKSRNLRDLIDYIQYQDPDQEVLESNIVSVFDLLYKEYSPRLAPLAARLKHRTEFASENIIWTLLHEILQERAYVDFTVVDQVVLHNLLPDLTKLTPEQAAYLRHRTTTLDFVVYNRITNRPAFAIEVDGFAFHENDPIQLARDAHKDAICAVYHIPLLRLATTGSGEENILRGWLDAKALGGA